MSDNLSMTNQMRRLAGLTVDYVAEAAAEKAAQQAAPKKSIFEAREVPGRKHQIAPQTADNMEKRMAKAKECLEHIEEAISCLEAIPATNVNGDVAHMIQELEAVLHDDEDGVSLNSMISNIQAEYRSWRRDDRQSRDLEQESEEAMVGYEEEELINQKLAEMKPVLQISDDAKLKMTKKTNKVDGYIFYPAEDEEVDVTIEFDHAPGRDAQDDPDKDNFGPAQEGECEVYAVTTSTGEEINPDSLDLEAAEAAIGELVTAENYGEIVKEDHFKVGQIVTDADTDKTYKVTKIENEGEKDEIYHTKCTKSDKIKKFKPSELKESMHFYNQSNYSDWEKDESDPVNVADGSSNSEQVWDEPGNPENDRDESPHQLANPMSAGTSPQDQSVGDEAKITVPAKIKTALQDEINQARAEAKQLDVRDKEASYFYNDLANAFEDLLNHLKGGTRYDIKQAQIYMTSLMGPMLHKVPATVVNFIARGGENMSLKDYYKPVKAVPASGIGPQHKLS